jgi:lipooligosaccharide transport system permease protein
VASYGADVAPAMIAVHIGFLAALTLLGILWAVRVYTRRLRS